MLKLGVQAAVEAVVLVHQVEAAAEEAQEDQAIILQEVLPVEAQVHHVHQVLLLREVLLQDQVLLLQEDQATILQEVLLVQAQVHLLLQEDQATILQEALQDQVQVHLLQAHQDLQEALRVQVLQVERVLLEAQAMIQHHLRVLDQLQHLRHLVLQLFREAQVMIQHQVVTQLLLLQEDLTTILVERQICAIPFLLEVSMQVDLINTDQLSFQFLI
jgi:hypothetical protein